MKECTVKVNGFPCGKKMALRDYASHLKIEHQIELLGNPIELYLTIRDRCEYIYDTVPAALGNDGVLVDRVLRYFYGMVIYDQETKRLIINLKYEDFIDYLVPFIESITRAGRDLREEAKKHPELHQNWIISDHVRVYRGSKFQAYKNFFSGRKEIEKL